VSRQERQHLNWNKETLSDIARKMMTEHKEQGEGEEEMEEEM
jgi:hypothetical protein